MNRNFNIDCLKGTLILLMIIGHIPFSSFNIEKTSVVNHFIRWLYFFHMPLFLAASVLFLKEQFNWILKRAGLILTPYFFWFLYGHRRLLLESPIEFMGKAFMGNWDSTNSVIWFLPALFSLNLIFFIFYRSSRSIQNLIFGVSFTTFLLAQQIANIHHGIPFGIDVALYIFILTFIIQKVYKNKERFLTFKYTYIVIVITISSYILFNYEPVKSHTQWHAIIDLAQFSVATTVWGYISFLGLNISLFILFLKIKPIGLIALVGKYSFPIFLLHLIVLYKIPFYLSINSDVGRAFTLTGSVLLSVVIPITVSKILMKISDKFKYIGMAK